MIWFKMVVVAVALVVPMIGAARAIELRNEDQRHHQVRITSATMEKEIEVRPNTLSLVVCIEECVFEVEGVGVVTATRSDVVTIRDGKVTKTPGPTRAETE